MEKTEIKQFLDEKVKQYNQKSFIEHDPISVPHQFSKKEDIEISGFFTAIFSWGQRKTIINKSLELMDLMGNNPHDFIINFSPHKFKRLKEFKHRTFNSDDLIYFMIILKFIYLKKGGLETVLSKNPADMQSNIGQFKEVFFSHSHYKRTEKHISDPMNNSSAKRINMFLRWMVRKDKNGVDFGIWDNIQPNQLYCPLDVHSGKIARELGLLKRKQDDWKAVEELTKNLREFDAQDPIKYDFALFGLGVNEAF